jgi:hypothetical protein
MSENNKMNGNTKDEHLKQFRVRFGRSTRYAKPFIVIGTDKLIKITKKAQLHSLKLLFFLSLE